MAVNYLSLVSSTILLLSTVGSRAQLSGPNQFPSCLSDCSSGSNPFNYQSQCNNATAISVFNTCVSLSACSVSDKNRAYQAVAQFCVDSGKTITAQQESTFSVTGANHPWASQWASSSEPWGADFSAWTSAHGTPGLSGIPGPFGGPNNPWSDGPWTNGGPWVSGPWTSWWGGRACPPGTWSGWTTGPWATAAPWTSWTACTATTTGSSVVTVTVTVSGSELVQTSTELGLQVNQATAAATSTSSQGSEAGPTSDRLAGSAAAVIGVIAGALLF